MKGIFDVAAAQLLIKAGALRQHLHHGLLQFRRQRIRRSHGVQICKQRRKTLLLRGRALGRRRDRHSLERRQLIS